jgi:hypothetical protein
VEGIFRESADTLERSVQHRRVDKEGGDLPPAEELLDDLKTQAITLSSERLRVVAKMDLVQVEDGHARPIDYKRGRPADNDGSLGLWPADRVQIVLQAMILLCRFSVKWRVGGSPLVSIPPLRGGDFQGIRVYRSDVFLGRARKANFRAQPHRLDEPTKLSLGMVASLQSPLLFHLAMSL